MRQGALGDVEGNGAIWAVALLGAGPAFSAGIDRKDDAGQGPTAIGGRRQAPSRDLDFFIALLGIVQADGCRPGAVRTTKETINRTYAIMGLRESLCADLDIAVPLRSVETLSHREVGEITQRHGFKAAMARCAARFGGDG